ncbi:hypothetical protein [Avibacterium paragallinarum]|uniref:XRE family transcriptional regulator n=1 Tax=Avibacterium paragallinarum TaxID=728 RepID=A0AAE5TIQ7_AVIPA|nr:hypothetical protein [Avibacterium paragallinarum]MEE3609358.1 hypothetical protein [Avibacterium paragallinarum]MEE3621486.1 hypothetical protein [Avibacterium paragallinarum]MEE3669373.1 hypothetical protein [Avibacterium paragallinarum]MEE3681677.1 hypothetical protein [Avibacterium paragallinarum]MEE4386679.1 hypothetical protein [Avibacterium paragallinarum]
MTKKISNFKLNPDLIRARCLSARLLARKSPERAAAEMGYTNTSMISKMERKTSKTAINHNFLARASLCYGVSMDYLLGMSNYPERDPRSVEQLAIYSSVQHYTNQLLEGLTETIVKGASAQVLSMHLSMLCDESAELVDAVNRMRELNPNFDEDIKAGSLVMKQVDKINQRISSTRRRLSKESYDDNILRQFKSVLSDGSEKQLDLVGYRYGD